jgi:hypothetical protein
MTAAVARVDPGVDAPEFADCRVRDQVNLRGVGDIRHGVDGATAVATNRLRRVVVFKRCARGRWRASGRDSAPQSDFRYISWRFCSAITRRIAPATFQNS